MKLKLTFFYLFIFTLLYLQVINIGPVKISFIFNGIILFYCSTMIIYKKNTLITPIGKWSLLSSLKVLISYGVFYNLSSVFIDSMKSITFPIIYLYLINFRNFTEIKRMSIFLSFLIISSSIPFLLNFINPINSGYNLNIFGSTNSGFIGLFENSHSASVIVSICLLVLIYFVLLEKRTDFYVKRYKIILIITILLGFYVEYKTYIRTGYLFLAVGLITFVIYSFNFKNIIYYIIFFIPTLFILFYVFNNDATLQARLLDNQQYSSGNAEKDLGSGRILFQLSSIKIWLNASFGEKIIGIGQENFMERMEPLVGMKIYAHNGFMTFFVKDGIAGLFLYLRYNFSLISSSIKSKMTNKLLPIAISFSYISYQMVQGGVISSIMEIMLALIFSLLYCWDRYPKNAYIKNLPKKLAYSNE